MDNTLSTTKDKTDSLIYKTLFKIQSELQIKLPNNKFINFFIFNKESDDNYAMNFRYFPGVTVLGLIKANYNDVPEIFISEEKMLGNILIDVDIIKKTMFDSNIIGNIQVEGYLEPASKDIFDFANDLLNYIVKRLQSLLKEKYVITYKKPFDIKGEIKLIDNKWQGSEYDFGIFKLLEKIQAFCRMSFINNVKNNLIENDICSLIGFRKYDNVINNEYSIISDSYFESNTFKFKLNFYIYELYLQKKSDETFEIKLENRLLDLKESIILNKVVDSYVKSVKATGYFGINEFPISNLKYAFTPKVQRNIKFYIDVFINELFI